MKTQEVEVVKYMANLPSFLKKSNQKDSVLDVGVLDWKRVEQWKRDRHHLHPSFSFMGEESQSSSIVDQVMSSISGAILRAYLYNGYPFFTFSVEDSQVLLAGTMDAPGSKSGDAIKYAFSFYSVTEVKKFRGRWLLCSGKEKARHYIHNPVAQLNVSSSTQSLSSIFAESHCFKQSCVREYVLLPVGAQQEEQKKMNFHPHSELAAIVINSQGLYRTRKNCEREEIASSCRVVLPGGVHSFPCNGCPSSLIQRWKSGGSCDCGGWDLGCQLRILIDHQNQPSTGPTSPVTDKFELSLQGEGNGRLFSFVSINEHAYSVRFDSSLSPIQAFSICVAVRDSKIRLWDAFDCKCFEEEDTSSIGPKDRTWASSVAREVTSRFISYPPPSPVGRV